MGGLRLAPAAGAALMIALCAAHGQFLFGQTVFATYYHADGRHIVADLTGERVVFRGVNLNGLEFGSRSTNPYPGVLGTNYFLPRSQDLDAVKSMGLNVIRVPFEWARLVTGWKPSDPLPTALNATYLTLLDSLVGQAAARQIYVVLEMHDFLKYWSGYNQEVCVNESAAHQQLLAQTWRLIASHFSDNPAVLGYDLMNEPVRSEPGEPCGSCNWHNIARAIVEAIRGVDGNHLIFVEGMNYSLSSHWPVENGTTPFIMDQVIPGRIVYSPHVFFDGNNDSRYDQPGEAVGPPEK